MWLLMLSVASEPERRKRFVSRTFPFCSVICIGFAEIRKEWRSLWAQFEWYHGIYRIYSSSQRKISLGGAFLHILKYTVIDYIAFAVWTFLFM